MLIENYIRINVGDVITMYNTKYYQSLNNKVIRLDDECTVVKDINYFDEIDSGKIEKIEKYNKWKERLERLSSIKNKE